MPAFAVVALFYFGCVLGHFIVNNDVQLQFTLYYHDVAVVMIVICLCVSCTSLVLNIDPVGSHAPHHLVSELAVSPPPAPLCSEALPVALQGRDRQKCDLRHAGQ